MASRGLCRLVSNTTFGLWELKRCTDRWCVIRAGLTALPDRCPEVSVLRPQWNDNLRESTADFGGRRDHGANGQNVAVLRQGQLRGTGKSRSLVLELSG